MKRSKGFTLVELLVVISIIAVLLAVLMPSLRKARLLAQRIVCMNNTRQQYLAQNTYTLNNDGKFATNFESIPWNVKDKGIDTYAPQYMNSRGEKAATAYAQYKPYIKNSKIFLCPAIQDFAIESPKDWGMCRDTKWYSNAYTNDKGGWDATVPGSTTQPYYLSIPYNWYANLTPCDGYGKPYTDVTYYGGEVPWPRTAAECSSTKIMITHPFMCDKGTPYFRDMGHGGSTTKWIRITGGLGNAPMGTTSVQKIKSLDNPAAYADGHTDYIMRNATIIRAIYNQNKVQIAW
ncbi:MAG: type II secretion system protein [Phycisphaerae bacterium]|jgi:type II secretory pathway pseudopilin PulG